MTSSFDPTLFLDATSTEANDTKLIPVPVGEFTAVAEKVEVKTWASRNDPSKAGIKLVIDWSIDDASVKEVIQRDKATVRQDIMLDTNESGTGLDMGKGKNIGLGRVRQALGLNVPGQPFSPSMIQGRVAKVSVKHRVDGENIYAEVGAVAQA